MERALAIPPHGTYLRFTKPALDRIFGTLLALITLPALLVLLAVSWATFGWPPLERVTRIGRGGRRFNLYRIHTRKDYQTDLRGRRLRISRWLRSTSLDELPQLWNVAFGQLSLVGPRPLDPITALELAEIADHRHTVRPGLTGPWQLQARGDGRRLTEHPNMDLRYVKRVTFATDLEILLRTVPALLRSREEV